MKQSRSTLLVLLFSLCAFGIAAYEDPTIPQDARASATGGRHAALADDITTIHNNPAGLQGLDREIQYSELTLGVTGPIFDITGLVLEQALGGIRVEDRISEPNVQNLLRGLYASLNLTGPVSFSYVGGGLGFGVLNWFDLEVASVTSTDLSVIIKEIWLITGGYSFRLPLPETFPGTIDLGGMLKTTIQAEMIAEKSILDVVDLFGDPFALFNEPLAVSLGVGVDLGVLYRYGGLLSVGIVGHDVFTPTRRSEYSSFEGFQGSETPVTSTNLVAPDLSVGVAYSPRIEPIERYVDQWKFFLDYRDSLELLIEPDTARNPLLNIGLGVEAVMLEILSLRVGFTDGLPAGGIGLDLTFLDLDVSVFGTEISTEPGLRSAYSLILGFRFSGRTGSQKQ